MGLFDLFKGGKSSAKDERPRTSPVAKWAETAGNRRAQNYDRQEAISALASLIGPGEGDKPSKDKDSDTDAKREERARVRAEASAALLKRFTFTIDPSITDQEEKDAAFAAIVRAGEDAVIPVRTFAAKAESLTWSMKVLRELIDEDAYLAELLKWLGKWDTEYAKFIDPKIQLLIELEDHEHPAIREAVEPFLEDVNETARFHAVSATLAQKDPNALPALLRLLQDEESLRVKNKLVDGLVALAWTIDPDARDAARKALPPGYTINSEGKLQKR